MIPDKYNNLSERLKQLFEWGDPRKPSHSNRYWDNYLAYGFSDADVPVLLELLSDKKLHDSLDQHQIWVPLHAWRILGQLRSAEAIDPLIILTGEYKDEDWIESEVPLVLAMIGKPAMERVAGILLDATEKEELKETAVSVLVELRQQHPELHKEVINYFRKYLQSPNSDYYEHNGLLVSHLLDINAVELIDGIRTLYEKDSVDTSIAGDLEDVEIDFGLRTERSTPKPKYNMARLEKLSQLLGQNTVRDNLETYVRKDDKVGRNEPCPCGSGKKYKRCCIK